VVDFISFLSQLADLIIISWP